MNFYNAEDRMKFKIDFGYYLLSQECAKDYSCCWRLLEIDFNFHQRFLLVVFYAGRWGRCEVRGLNFCFVVRFLSGL